MIKYTSIVVKNNNDYDKLAKTTYYKKYFDDSLIIQLKKYIGTKCGVIELEYPYYDSDYLSSYYNFYVKRFKDYSKRSLRIILFSNTKRTDILGYITLRPTYTDNYLSRIILEPTISNKKCAVMVAPYKIHYKGAEVNLFEFPEIGQESMGAAVCAHVSIWAILRYFSNRFHKYPEMPLSYVAGYKIDRLLDGDLKNQSLTVGGIATILKSQGYSPLLIDKDIFENNEYFREEMFAYILSGFPLIGVSKKSKHAFVIVGIQKPSACINFENDDLFNLSHRKGASCNLIPTSKFYPGIIVNDDHHFPYRVVGYTESETEYELGEVDSIIVPLYDRITLSFSSVLDYIRVWYDDGRIPKELGWSVDERMYYSIFLTSYNTYKEYLVSQGNLNQCTKAELMRLETPKFIWCIEFSCVESMKNNLVDHIMLLDSTSSTEDNLAVLLVTGNKCIQIVDNGKIYVIPNCGEKSLGISPFGKNLENYN